MQDTYGLIATEMATLAHKVQTWLQSDKYLLQPPIQHCFKVPGKQMRPMSVFLTAGACGGITEATYRGAMLVTLLHQAALVHDDVVDDAPYRRGQPTINTAWGNRMAILLGDYLLAKGLRLATQHKDYDFLERITASAQAMSEGELLQLAHSQRVDFSEEDYLDVIHKKTAHLWGTCFAIGAMATQSPDAQVHPMCQAGEHMGMAFQIQDDILDYGTHDTGKQLGMDLGEGKRTLPLIYALRQANAPVRTQMEQIVQSSQKNTQQRQAIVDFVQTSGGIEYAQRVAGRYCQQALELLQDLPDTPYKMSLLSLVTYAADRER